MNAPSTGTDYAGNLNLLSILQVTVSVGPRRTVVVAYGIVLDIDDVP